MRTYFLFIIFFVVAFFNIEGEVFEIRGYKTGHTQILYCKDAHELTVCQKSGLTDSGVLREQTRRMQRVSGCFINSFKDFEPHGVLSF